MNAQDLPFTQLLDGAKQFIVPIFQRDYSWGDETLPSALERHTACG